MASHIKTLKIVRNIKYIPFINLFSIAKQTGITIAKLLKYEAKNNLSPQGMVSLNVAGDQYRSMPRRTFLLIHSFYLT